MNKLLDTTIHAIKEFADILDSRGGQLFLALIIFLVGAHLFLVGAHTGADKLADWGKEVGSLCLGALLQAMRADRTANGVTKKQEIQSEVKTGS